MQRGKFDLIVVTRHQYEVSALVSQTSFGGETSDSVAKCWLFSHARFQPMVPKWLSKVLLTKSCDLPSSS